MSSRRVTRATIGAAVPPGDMGENELAVFPTGAPILQHTTLRALRATADSPLKSTGESAQASGPSRGHSLPGEVTSFSPRPILVTVPSEDREFENFVHIAYDHAPADPTSLQAALRTRYPEAVVQPRQLEGEPFTTWYVYRDGRWQPRRIGESP